MVCGCSNTIFWKSSFFPQWSITLTLFINQLSLCGGVGESVDGFCSDSLVNLSNLWQYYTILSTTTLEKGLDISGQFHLHLQHQQTFLPWSILAILSQLLFYTTSRIRLTSSKSNRWKVEIFIGFVLNLLINFERTNIFT